MKKKFERKISVLFYTFGNKKIGFGSEFNEVSIIYQNKVEKIEKNLKSQIANKIVKKIINHFI